MKIFLLLFNIFLIQAFEFDEDSGFEGIVRMEENAPKNWTYLEKQMMESMKMNRQIMHDLREIKHLERKKIRQENLRKWMNFYKTKNMNCERKSMKMQGQIQAFQELGGKIIKMLKLPRNK